jgi:DNA-binding GntR family transcriptional regulator
MSVSRTPVREAMGVLEGQGLIVRLRGRGTYVAPATTPEEAETLFELRVPLESFLAGNAAQIISAREMEVLRRLQQAFNRELRSQLVRHGDKVGLTRLVVLDSDFHWTIYNAAGGGLVSVVASYWGRLLRELYHQVYAYEHPSRFSEQHDVIIAALERRESDGARAAMAEHIQTGLVAIQASLAAAAAKLGRSTARAA